MSARRHKALAPRIPILAQHEWDILSNELALSPRQKDILHLIMQGHQDRQIAAELDVSHATVRTHLRLLFERLGVSDRTELVLHSFAVLRDASSKQMNTN